MGLSTDRSTIHGVLVWVAGRGVLITGESGTGKSECALELVSNGHGLVSDDVVMLARDGDAVFGRAPERFAGFLAVSGLGILDVRQVFGPDACQPRSKVDLSIDLVSDKRSDPLGGLGFVELFGVKIPGFRINVMHTRNLRLIVETAVKLIETNGLGAAQQLTASHDALVATAAKY